MDLIGSLSTLPQADTRRVSVAGHSNGGGVAELVMVVDSRDGVSSVLEDRLTEVSLAPWDRISDAVTQVVLRRSGN